MATEPGQLVLTLLDDIVNEVKSTRPARTDGKALTTDFVYSQMVLGMPIDPQDYMNPWSPMGGSTLQDTVGATAPTTSGSTSTPSQDPKFRKAIESAFKTSELVDTMIMVTDDDSYLEYPTTRHISFVYDGIINSMQPLAMPPIPLDIQKQIDDAQKVLYQIDDQGNIVGKSQLYRTYIKNATTYAQAKKDYADAQAAALNNPAKADTWPQDSVTYQQAVDQAWNTLKTEGSDKIERALDIIESIGVSMQDRMIAKARKLYDAWNLGLTGVAATIPYSYISPTRWSDPSADDEGWSHLHVEQFDYHNHTQSHYRGQTETQTHSDSSTGGGGVGVFLGFVNLAAGASGGSEDIATSSNWHYALENSFHNDATGLTIDLEYALCSIERPWLIGDLFYMQNWYLVNNAKNAISDGTIQGQVKNVKPLMPMIPVQFLVIRNVTISATNWANDGDTITSIFGSTNYNSSTTSTSGGGGFSLGFISFGGTGAHSSSSSNAKGDNTVDSSSDYNVHWNGQTLSIQGTQIIAWLSEIVPTSAPLDDPHLSK